MKQTDYNTELKRIYERLSVAVQRTQVAQITTARDHLSLDRRPEFPFTGGRGCVIPPIAPPTVVPNNYFYLRSPFNGFRSFVGGT